MCVLFKLAKSSERASKLPHRDMASEVSVSSAARDEKSFTAANFASNPLFKSYDQAAEHENRLQTAKHVDAGTVDEGSPTASDCPRRLDDDPTALSPEDIASRLERTRREFYNRRKIIIKNLPSDISNQVCNVNVHQTIDDLWTSNVTLS